MKTATGRDAYIIKHTLIDLRKDQYIIKNAYRKPIVMTKSLKSKNFILNVKLHIYSFSQTSVISITFLNNLEK